MKRQKVKSQDDGLLHTLGLINNSCVITGCSVSQNGASAVDIGTGVFFVGGRLVYVTSLESLGAPSVSAGQTLYVRAVFEVNMNQTNTAEDFLQGSFKVLSDAVGLPYAIHLIPPEAIFAMSRTLKQGAEKYETELTEPNKENWRSITDREHINHALAHLFAYLAGDVQDDHLEHALC